MNPSVSLHRIPFHRIDVRPLVTVSVVVVVLVLLLPPLPAKALESRAFVGDVVVEQGDYADEVFTTFGDATVNGPVAGDVHTALGDIRINGHVGGSVNAGVGDVRVRAPVAGEVDAGFGDVYVDSLVKGDVDVNHGDVHLGPDAQVMGDVRCGNGKIYDASGYEVQGTMGAGTMPNLDSSDDGELFSFVGWFLAAAGFAACCVLASMLAPRTLHAAAQRAEEVPGRSLFVGLVSVPAVLMLGVALAVSVVGVPLLLLLAPAYLALLFFGALVAAFFVGRKVALATGRYRSGNVLAAVVGAFALAVTPLIPIIGEILLFALALLGTGAATLAFISRRRTTRPSYPSYEAFVQDRRDA